MVGTSELEDRGQEIEPRQKLARLTKRQLQLLSLYGKGYEYKEIANKLSIAPVTVTAHMRDIRIKLDLDDPDLPKTKWRTILLTVYYPLVDEIIISIDSQEHEELEAKKEPGERIASAVNKPVTTSGRNEAKKEPGEQNDGQATKPQAIWFFGGAGIVLIIAFIFISRFFNGFVGGVPPVITPSVTHTITDKPKQADTLTMATTATPNTLSQTSTATANPVPATITCRHPDIAPSVFLQFSDKQPFLFPLFEDFFVCDGVSEESHSPPFAVKIDYQDQRNEEQFGIFGVALNGFDATVYSRLCLWVYSLKPSQAFWLKLKDMHAPPNENEISISISSIGEWTEYCPALDEFERVDLSQLESIILGFDSRLGNSEIWIDDIEFRE